MPQEFQLFLKKKLPTKFSACVYWKMIKSYLHRQRRTVTVLDPDPDPDPDEGPEFEFPELPENKELRRASGSASASASGSAWPKVYVNIAINTPMNTHEAFILNEPFNFVYQQKEHNFITIDILLSDCSWKMVIKLISIFFAQKSESRMIFFSINLPLFIRIISVQIRSDLFAHRECVCTNYMHLNSARFWWRKSVLFKSFHTNF